MNKYCILLVSLLMIADSFKNISFCVFYKTGISLLLPFCQKSFPSVGTNVKKKF
jgi:hypothetical protein